MQQVITQKEARTILGGRAPHMPVEYEAAVKALAECITLDEAKYWNNKADALAAWARIYHSSEAERKAKQLKLHAYRRMGQLAEELRPTIRDGKRQGNNEGRSGHAPGARSLLIQSGLKTTQAAAALTLGRLDDREFERHVNLPRPRAPQSINTDAKSGSESHRKIQSAHGGAFRIFKTFCKQHSASSLARGLSAGEYRYYIESVRLMTEWLDEFEQNIPRGSAGALT